MILALVCINLSSCKKNNFRENKWNFVVGIKPKCLGWEPSIPKLDYNGCTIKLPKTQIVIVSFTTKTSFVWSCEHESLVFHIVFLTKYLGKIFYVIDSTHVNKKHYWNYTIHYPQLNEPYRYVHLPKLPLSQFYLHVHTPTRHVIAHEIYLEFEMDQS